MPQTMAELEKDIQNRLVNFCKKLPNFLENWSSSTKKLQNHLEALENYTVQLKQISKVNLQYLENFKYNQQKLEGLIMGDIGEENRQIQTYYSQLNRAKNELFNDLKAIEEKAQDLDWESDTELIRGSPIQPPLSKLLQMSYDFIQFFQLTPTTTDLVNCKKDLEDNVVQNLLALTQYLTNRSTIH